MSVPPPEETKATSDPLLDLIARVPREARALAEAEVALASAEIRRNLIGLALAFAFIATLGMMVLFGQASGPVPPLDLGQLAAKGSLFVTRPTLFAYTAKREELLASAQDLFDVVASGAVKIAVNQTYRLADAAHAARTSGEAEADARASAESALTGALSAVLTPEDVTEVASVAEGAEMLAELSASCRRVQLSRRFLNDAVRACRQLRGQRMCRTFRLAGHTAWPESWEMDDEMPSGLASR